VAALSIVAGVACGASAGDGSAPAIPPAPPACGLLAASDIEAVIGEPVESGEPLGPECTFRRPPNREGLRTTAARLRVEVRPGTPEDALDWYKDRVITAMGDYQPQPEPGLGGAGAWDGTQMITSVSADDRHSLFVVVQLAGVDEDARGRARRLVEEVLRRLRTVRQSGGQGGN
jgi:hypothetical protein